MERNLKKVDCIIEVHDARIPFSGRNEDFKAQLTSVKPHILVLNKSDLTDMRVKHEVEKKLVSRGINAVLHTNLQNSNLADSGFKKILPTAMGMIKSGERYNRQDLKDYHLMIVGVPNVGKSTLINRFRARNGKTSAAQVGKCPGVTRHVMERIKICDDPKIYILDTPGILQPRVDYKKNLENIMKLALVSSISDSVIGSELIADYQLYWLNKNGHFSYVDYFKLNEPSDSINEVLINIAVNLNLKKAFKHQRCSSTLMEVPDILRASDKFIQTFREGLLGKFFLDINELGIGRGKQGSTTWEEYQRIRDDIEQPPVIQLDDSLKEEQDAFNV